MNAVDEAYSTALTGAILVDRPDRGVVRVFGRDPVRMVNGLVSNDVQSLEPGHAVYATMLTAKGRMLADVRVIRRVEDVLIEADRAALPNVRDTMKRFVPPLFARTEDQGDALAIIGVYGPASTRLVDRVFDGAAVAMAHDPTDSGSGDDAGAGLTALERVPVDDAAFAAFDDQTVSLMKTDLYGVDGWDIVIPVAISERVRDALFAAGAMRASLDTLEILRIEAGGPRWGAELTEAVIPLEAGLNDRAISTSKGCYTGQEVIIRVLHRGHVNRNLRGLLLTGDSSPEPGAELYRSADAGAMAGRGVARITSATFSPRLGRSIALAYVRREVEPGETVYLGSTDGAPAQVVVLPFAVPEEIQA